MRIKFITNLTLTIVFYLIVLPANSQISNVSTATGEPIKVKGKTGNVQGSPYLIDDAWKQGTITDKFGKSINNVLLRYNAYLDRVEYAVNGDPYFYNNDQIKSFTVNRSDGSGEVFSFKNGYDLSPELEKDDLVRVLYAGDNFDIVERVRVVVIEVTPAAYGEEEYEKFIFDNETYLIKNGKIQDFKIRKSSFLKAFSEHKSNIKTYIKNNNITISEDSDITRLSNYIDKNLI